MPPQFPDPESLSRPIPVAEGYEKRIIPDRRIPAASLSREKVYVVLRLAANMDGVPFDCEIDGEPFSGLRLNSETVDASDHVISLSVSVMDLVAQILGYQGIRYQYLTAGDYGDMVAPKTGIYRTLQPFGGLPQLAQVAILDESRWIFLPRLLERKRVLA